MLRVASLILGGLGVVQLLAYLVLGAIAFARGYWEVLIVLVPYGLLVSLLLLWLSLSVARSKHLRLAIGVLGFLGASCAVAAIVAGKALPFWPLLGIASWGGLLLLDMGILIYVLVAQRRRCRNARDLYG